MTGFMSIKNAYTNKELRKFYIDKDIASSRETMIFKIPENRSHINIRTKKEFSKEINTLKFIITLKRLSKR